MQNLRYSNHRENYCKFSFYLSIMQLVLQLTQLNRVTLVPGYFGPINRINLLSGVYCICSLESAASVILRNSYGPP